MKRGCFYLAGIFGLALFVTGCATDERTVEQTRKIEMGDYQLSATNAAPGSVYDLRVYVIASGDTFKTIAKQFQISVSDLKALNPDVQPFRLRVGEKIRVFEREQ